MTYRQLMSRIDAADAGSLRKIWAKMKVTVGFAAGWVCGAVYTLFTKRR